jgi:hypothetical protein
MRLCEWIRNDAGGDTGWCTGYLRSVAVAPPLACPREELTGEIGKSLVMQKMVSLLHWLQLFFSTPHFENITNLRRASVGQRLSCQERAQPTKRKARIRMKYTTAHADKGGSAMAC